ncbi:PD-(D/E)XK nuclease-like domain-containing protein [Terribacillus saccharophilus]|uniref:PD-(D/E)XK nuclease-like domain-containing protein n=1 Tax=Terribacillus saccharophilus TaxID=361277 RepID=UPI0038167FA1
MMSALMTLTQANYHSTEANRDYFSVSQFKRFDQCEAKAMAELKGEFKEPTTNALLVGSYVHAAFESDEAFNEILTQNSDAIFKNNGSKYADFETADRMIEALKNDDLSMFALTGEKEFIMTAELFGVPWKMKADNINLERGFFSDIKTTQELHKRYWSNKYVGWVSFIEAWDYVLQMALYRLVIKANTGKELTPYIVAVTKENPCNKAVVHFDESRFAFEEDYLEMRMERFKKVKSGEEEPISCGNCNYCRQTKKLADTIEVGALLYE